MFDSMEAQILAIEIQQLYRELDYTVQTSFVNYLEDEISVQDDEVGPIVDGIIFSLRNHHNLETTIDRLCAKSSTRYVVMVLQATYEYLKDIYYD
jgi:hypothetical protein